VLFLLNRGLGHGRRDGDIDVVAVGPAGVYVVDVKRYNNKEVTVRRSGGLFSPTREQLVIAGRDRTTLLASLVKQQAAVSHALADFPGVIPPVAAMLCFIDALLPLFGTPTIQGVPLVGAKRAARRLQEPGEVDEPNRHALHVHLAHRLPPA
jgi:hypothetical protein